MKRHIKLLKYQRNAVVDPAVEVSVLSENLIRKAKYFPYLTRTSYEKADNILSSVPSRTTDYFALNPPPPSGSHPDGGNRWWWAQEPPKGMSLT